MKLTQVGKMALNEHVKKYGKKKGMDIFSKAITSNKRGTDKWHDPKKKKVRINKYAQVLSDHL